MPWALTPFCKKCRKYRSVNGTRYCTGCQPEQRQHTRTRINAAKVDKLRRDPLERALYQFYKSKRWRDTRKVKLSLNPLCEDCDANGRTVAGKEVDHVTRIKDGGEPFDLSNLRTLCKSCHAAKRGREGHHPLPHRPS